ncbi:hypothetical protein D9M71_419900 [compost metagenome]
MHRFDVVAAGLGAKRHATVEPGGHHRLASGVQVATESGRDLQSQFDFRALQALVQLFRVANRCLLGEVARAAEGFEVGAALRALVLVIDGEGQVLHVQRDAVAEYHHHEHGAEQGECQAYLVAQQFFAFARGHGKQAADAETLRHDHWRCRGGRIQLGGGRRRFARFLGLFQASDESIFEGLTGELLLQRRRRVAGQYLAGVHQGNAVAAQRFVHEVGGQEDGHALIARQFDQQAPEVIAGGRVDP